VGQLLILVRGQLTWLSLLTVLWLSLVSLFPVRIFHTSSLLLSYFLLASGTLYVARTSVIELYDASTNVMTGSWPATNAGQLALDNSGNLWVSAWSGGGSIYLFITNFRNYLSLNDLPRGMRVHFCWC
jgi:hypothetical protein